MYLQDLINTLSHVQPHQNKLTIAALTAMVTFTIIFSYLTTTDKRGQLTSILLVCASMVVLAFSFVSSSIARTKHQNDYTLTKDKTYLYINSHTDYLTSAKCKILSHDNNYIYVTYKDKTYKIHQIQDK